MSAAPSVLVLTDRYDPTADFVVSELNRREVPVFRADTREFPTELTVGAEIGPHGWQGRIKNARRSIDLATVSGIWYRRPTAFTFADGMSADERRWAATQARLGFGGLLASCEPWLNHPHRIGYAEYKPVQLHLATQCGLAVPRTIVTNEPETAREFVAGLAQAIYKPFGGTSAIIDTDGTHQLFATRVTAGQAANASVGQTMHLFQEWIPKDHEVRLTVVDNQFFAARIDAHTLAAETDWRADYRALEYAPIETPASVRTRVIDLFGQLGLRFGALDFVVDPAGNWWFLECNPNGQWAWIETETAMPITSALADALQGRTK